MQATKFLLNALVLPLGLQALVWTTWRFQNSALCCEESEQKPKVKTERPLAFEFENAAELEQDISASRRGDHYFALFLTCASRRNASFSGCD